MLQLDSNKHRIVHENGEKKTREGEKIEIHL